MCHALPALTGRAGPAVLSLPGWTVAILAPVLPIALLVHGSVVMVVMVMVLPVFGSPTFPVPLAVTVSLTVTVSVLLFRRQVS